MKVFFDKGFYKAAKISGPRHNYLGIKFASSNKGEAMVVRLDGSEGLTGIDVSDVKCQVECSLNEFNLNNNTDYKIEELQMVSSDTPSAIVYKELAAVILSYYHNSLNKDKIPNE